MADLSASQKVEVQALWDGTQLKRGSEEAERSIEDLARVFDTETDQIRRSLDDMDRGVQDTLGSGGSLDRAQPALQAQGTRTAEVGSEIGQEFTQNMAEGFNSGDFTQVVADTFANLGAIIGPLGLGFVVGATLVKNMIQGAKDKAEDFQAAVDTIFESVEARAGEAQAKVRRRMVQAFTFDDAVKAAGGTDSVEDSFQILIDKSREIGVPWQALLKVYRQGITPATQSIVDRIEAIKKESILVRNEMGLEKEIWTDTTRLADEMLTSIQDRDKQLQQGATAKKAEGDWMYGMARDGITSADAMERYGRAAQRARGDVEKNKDDTKETARAMREAAEAASRYAAAVGHAAARRLPDSIGG